MAHILLLEDDDDFAEMVASVLIEELGLQVSRAADSAVVLKMQPQPPWDLVLTDVRIEGALNGIETMRRLRQRFPQLAFLVMTGYADLSVPGQAAQMSALQYLIKPFALSELMQAVQQGLRHGERKAEVGLTLKGLAWLRKTVTGLFASPPPLQQVTAAREQAFQQLYVLIRARAMLKNTGLYLWEKLEALEARYLQALTQGATDNPADYHLFIAETQKLGRDSQFQSPQANRHGRLEMAVYQVFHKRVEEGLIDDKLFFTACALRLKHQELEGPMLEDYAKCWL